jgi:hypothetical protein
MFRNDIQGSSEVSSITIKSGMFPRLENKPFWIWDQKQHKQDDIRTGGDYRFNHVIGLPKNSWTLALFSFALWQTRRPIRKYQA